MFRPGSLTLATQDAGEGSPTLDMAMRVVDPPGVRSDPLQNKIFKPRCEMIAATAPQ